MNELYLKCPNFVRSLWPQKNIFDNQVSSSVKDDNMAILNLSILLLQTIEDHFTGGQFDLTGEIVWAGNFLQWCNSTKFYEMWKILYPNFKSTTNEYVELLFKYSKGVQIQTGDDLMKLATEFSIDSKLNDILKKIYK